VENGETVIVGVNEFVMSEEEENIETFRVNPEVEAELVENLRQLKRERHNQKVERALERVSSEVEKGKNMMPSIVEAVKVYATEGEIIGELKKSFGEYDQNIVF
jgi:methylmalonyl-CoA mutase N-terminal domain/subunit